MGQIFVQIVLFHTFLEISAFFHFMQKFKMASKNGRTTIFGKTWQMTVYMQTCLGVNHVVLNDKVKFLLNESTVKICEHLEI